MSVQNDFESNPTRRPPVPASGRVLMIGNEEPNLLFCASPTTGANVIWQDSSTKAWKASQGDIFKGRLGLGDVFQDGEEFDYISFFDPSTTAELDVVVKVSSIGVHNMLISPQDSLRALTAVRQSNNIDLLREIQSVLYAAVEMDGGLITIMSDLSKQGFQEVAPSNHPDKLGMLWAAFQELVETMLLPMAERRVIHSDIRPGYDLTANILWKLEGNNGVSDKATMKLIDYESMVLFRYWDAPTDDGRYIQKIDKEKATTFVWWQCIAVAYSWKEKISAETLRHEDGMTQLESYLNGIGGPDWLKKFRACAQQKEISSQLVRKTLDDLAKEFHEHPIE